MMVEEIEKLVRTGVMIEWWCGVHLASSSVVRSWRGKELGGRGAV